MKATAVTMYMCSTCQKLHKNAFDGDLCCARQCACGAKLTKAERGKTGTCGACIRKRKLSVARAHVTNLRRELEQAKIELQNIEQRHR